MFIALITGFNEYHKDMPIREFRYADWARDWVSSVHGVLDAAHCAGLTSDYLESAVLYRVTKSGKCVVVDRFDGLDRGDGLAAGWENECNWRQEKAPHYGCSHTKVKGVSVCRHHKRDPRYSVLPTGNFLDWPKISTQQLKRDAGLIPSRKTHGMLRAAA
jgi:hypothetical protein